MSRTGLPANIPAHYRVLSSPASGGQGTVYQCEDTNLSRTVAIKVLHGRGIMSDLATEVAALSSIQSKHVVQVFDVIVDATNNVVGLVQEFLPGDDLSGFSGLGTSQEEYLKVLFQVASGIADIHAGGKIHRDIKPENMRFDHENIVKIFDFGLACDQRGNPATTAGRGTDGYRAPELYTTSGQFNEAVDVYALGVMAWELAGNALPHVLFDVPPQHTGRVPSISTHPLGLPPDICDVVDRALLLDPAARPRSREIRDTVARRLLFGQHRAIVTSGTKTYTLTAVGASIRIAHGNIGRIEVGYDGLEFTVLAFEGDVYVNNVVARVGMSLPDSCVLTIGGPSLGAHRSFLPFNSSHPEVVL